MGKNVKLTEEAYLDLQAWARVDGLTLAGEIRKILAIRNAFSEIKALESLTEDLRSVTNDVRGILKEHRESQAPRATWGTLGEH